jgi:hypothetical protein
MKVSDWNIRSKMVPAETWCERHWGNISQVRTFIANPGRMPAKRTRSNANWWWIVVLWRAVQIRSLRSLSIWNSLISENKNEYEEAHIFAHLGCRWN